MIEGFRTYQAAGTLESCYGVVVVVPEPPPPPPEPLPPELLPPDFLGMVGFGPLEMVSVVVPLPSSVLLKTVPAG